MTNDLTSIYAVYEASGDTTHVMSHAAITSAGKGYLIAYGSYIESFKDCYGETTALWSSGGIPVGFVVQI